MKLTKITLLILVVNVTILLSGCNTNSDGSNEANNSSVESNESEENEKETSQEESPLEDTEEEYLESYSDILDDYYTALNEQWEAGALSDASLSILLPYSYEGDPLSNVGYALMDIDSNGIPELLIGAIAGDSFVDKMIFDMYTLSDDKATLVFNGSERNKYYLCSDNSIANESSGGAAFSSYSIYNLDSDGKSLKIIETVFSDLDSEDNVAWYYTTKEDMDSSDATLTTENEAIAKKESYENKYIQVEFTSFESWN